MAYSCQSLRHTASVASKELLLFKDYLKGRRQSVAIAVSIQTDHTRCSLGISPGALNIIFVNDLPRAVSRSIVDTTLSTFAPVLDLPAH